MAKLNSLIRWLTYRGFFVRVARALHLQGILETLYNRVMQPKGGISKASVRGIEAQFRVDQPGELRIVEVIGSSRGGEHRLIELLFNVSQPGDTFYDIGASIGTHSIFLAKFLGNNGRVVAFEPEPQSYQRFLANIALNQLTNIKVLPLALGNEESIGTLKDEEGLGTYTLLPSLKEIKAGGIKIVRGDQLRQNLNLPIPQVVKIDVEGFEFSVLQGLRLTLSDLGCRVVCYEYHKKLIPKELGFKDFEELMLSMGFQRHEINYRLGGFHVIWYKK